MSDDEKETHKRDTLDALSRDFRMMRPAHREAMAAAYDKLSTEKAGLLQILGPAVSARAVVASVLPELVDAYWRAKSAAAPIVSEPDKQTPPRPPAAFGFGATAAKVGGR